MRYPTRLLNVTTAIFLLATAPPVLANIPGGGPGTGPAVTLVNNGNGTVTLANGIVSMVCTTNGATINDLYYTYNNGSGPTTNQLLSGGTDGGKLYWETGGFSSGSFNPTFDTGRGF